MGVGKLSPPKQQNWTFHDFQGMTQPNGSTVWNNSLNTWARLKTKR